MKILRRNVSMQDHIGEIKHSAKQIYRCNHITRFEKYKLVRRIVAFIVKGERDINSRMQKRFGNQ